MQAETRVVLARSRRRRADTRALTEPQGHRRVRPARGSQPPAVEAPTPRSRPAPVPALISDGSEWVVETVPYRRGPANDEQELHNAARAAELAIDDLSRTDAEAEIDTDDLPRPSAEYLEMEIYRPIASLSQLGGSDDAEIPTVPHTGEVLETLPFTREPPPREDVEEPPTHKEEAQHRRSLQSAPRLRTDSMPWVGIVCSAPEVGACLVIGTYEAPEFRVTSPVSRIFPREGGVLVQTTTKSRYFVEDSGNAYLVRKVG